MTHENCTTRHVEMRNFILRINLVSELHIRKKNFYSWLSLSRILDVSIFVLSRNIHPVPWSFSTWSKQKTYSISNLDISNFCLCWANFPILWAVFFCNLKLSSKFSKPFWQISSQISLFLTPASTITAIVPARININTFKSIFLLFFLIESFDVLIECFELFITRIFHKASL